MCGAQGEESVTKSLSRGLDLSQYSVQHILNNHSCHVRHTLTPPTPELFIFALTMRSPLWGFLLLFFLQRRGLCASPPLTYGLLGMVTRRRSRVEKGIGEEPEAFLVPFLLFFLLLKMFDIPTRMFAHCARLQQQNGQQNGQQQNGQRQQQRQWRMSFQCAYGSPLLLRMGGPTERSVDIRSSARSDVRSF